MNFTPTNALLTGRVQPQQQQQVHQVPVTTAPGGAAQSGGMQKTPNLPVASFPVQQAANVQQKVNNDNKMQPTPVHQQPAQNNNNHGVGGSLQPLITTQHQAGVNRNVNLSQQASYQQSQPHISMPSLVQGVVQKSGSIFHQIQQMGYQSQQFHQTTAATQPQHVGPIHHGGMASQQSFQKLPPNISQPVHTMKHTNAQQHIQQQVKPVSNQFPPSVSQHNMQYSPSKSIHPHPQMKTTAKLASPGSQLQSLQKSPTAPNAPQSIGQQAASHNKNVPSTPPVSSPPPSVAPVLNTTTSHTAATTNISLVKTVPTTTLAKQGFIPSPTPQDPVVASNNAALAVPSQLSTTSPSPAKQTTPDPTLIAVEQAPTKTVEQSKEQPQAVPSQSKPVPKLSVEEKPPAVTQVVSTPVPETNNKVEKSPASKVEKVASVVEKQPAAAAAAVKPAASVSSPSKSTMRLATVTPARQKKPPATNNKKPVPAAPVASTPKTIIKAPPSPAKPVEAPKTPSAKKPQTPSPVVVSPKSTPAPAQKASSPQPSSSTARSATTPKTKRSRVKAQPYQCPTPELTLVTKLSTQAANSNSKKRNDDKLTIFYKNEFLAVRNSDGGFFLCQAMQNVYKSSPKIHIRWLDERNEGAADASSEARTYDVAFFDTTDFECVLTTVELDKVEGKIYELPKSEQTRIESILKKAIDVEKGIVPRPAVTEENPDGLDLSLYKDEAQLDKASPNKRKREVKSEDGDDEHDEDYETSPRKKKVSRREPIVKTPRGKKIVLVNDESTESDEENLMEIKKKAKKQASSTTPKTPVVKKAPEPTPSTSKASAPPARGRKRGAATAEVEIPAKVANVEKVEVVQESPATLKAKTPATKKPPTPKASPAVEKKPAEPRPVAEKRPATKKALPVEEVKAQALAQAPPKDEEKKTPTKASAKKKPSSKAKSSPAAASVTASPSEQQPSTSRSRNTRSKK